MDNKQSSFEEKEMVEYTNIENSPFTMVRTEDKYALLIGNVQVSEWDNEKNTKAKTDIKNMDWAMLTTIILTMVDKKKELDEIKNLIEKTNTNN